MRSVPSILIYGAHVNLLLCREPVTHKGERPARERSAGAPSLVSPVPYREIKTMSRILSA